MLSIIRAHITHHPSRCGWRKKQSMCGVQANIAVAPAHPLLCGCAQPVSHFLLKQSAHFSIMVISNSKPRCTANNPCGRVLRTKRAFPRSSRKCLKTRHHGRARSRGSGFAFCFTQYAAAFVFLRSCLFLFNETDTHPRRSKHNSDFKL